jgi:adenosylcobinamide kinase/adenosylcobinamide-phosphate guanylyltransferase
MARIILITGGSRSGKSTFAQQLAESLADNRIYLATCPVVDGEMAARIARHRRDREARSWRTIEEETALAATLGREPAAGVVLVDCLTLWINNLMYAAQREGRTLTEEEIQRKSMEVLQAARFGTGPGTGIRPTVTTAEQTEKTTEAGNPAAPPRGTQEAGTSGPPGETPSAGRIVIFVTNEVGMGIVPAYPDGRLFRDLAGRCNQVFAREADAVVFMVSGIPLWIKGGNTFSPPAVTT